MTDRKSPQSRAGKIGGLTRAARLTNEEGRKAAAAKGRMDRFYAQVPDSVTDPVERARRANLFMRVYMSRLAMRSAAMRSKRRAG